jgi:ABC-type nickel/cobalt efflux system permease component RcnA
MLRNERRISLCRIFAFLGFCLLLISPSGAFAHPMGNFTINHYAGIQIENGWIEIHYVIDMAEIPTFQELQRSGLTARLDDPHVPEYLYSQAQTLGRGLRVMLEGNSITLRLMSQDVIFPAGAGNLPTMKFGFVYRGEFSQNCFARPCQLNYEDINFADHAGWKEVVVVTGAGVSLVGSTASQQDRSGQLSNYPTDLINSPPQQLKAQMSFSFSGPGDEAARSLAAPNSDTAKNAAQSNSGNGDGLRLGREPGRREMVLKPNQQGTPRSSFTELIGTKQIGLGIVLLAALISAGLGALHALEPGHGKTIVAAYLVGSRGTARHAFLLGMIVTAAHTAGVYLLGVITIYAQKYILPDRLYPFLGVLSGTLIAGMGFYLFLQRYVGVGFALNHGPGGHRHFWDSSPKDSEVEVAGIVPRQPALDTRAARNGRVSARQLLVLGITGGIIPCPAALVVLLSAVALHRVGFGLFLIVAFSLGLAVVLVGMGLVAVYAGRMMSRLPLEGPLVQTWLPLTSAAMITILGCVIAARGLMASGIVQIRI